MPEYNSCIISNLKKECLPISITFSTSLLVAYCPFENIGKGNAMVINLLLSVIGFDFKMFLSWRLLICYPSSEVVQGINTIGAKRCPI